MSLKAKMEAVIYASEEPVTLAQLVGLLGGEGQAELDRRDGAQQRLALDIDDGAGSDRIEAEDVEAMIEGSPEPGLLVSETPLAVAGEEAVTLDEAAADEETAPAGTEDSTAGKAQDAPERDEKQRAREEKERARRLREFFRSLLDELVADYGNGDRGLAMREVAGGFRLATKPEYHDAVRGFVKSLKPPLKLTLQALETLAVVAYKQPVTGPEISEIRGVDSGGVLGSLMARKLIATAGRKQVIGRPILYKTTRDFLLRFGLKDVSELPSIEEFEKMAGELAEPESLQEEIAMGNSLDPLDPLPQHHAPESAADLQPEREIHEPQGDGDATPLSGDASSPTPDGEPTDPPAVRLTGTPPQSVVPGADDDPTEAAALAHENERDRIERSFPDDDGSKPTLLPR